MLSLFFLFIYSYVLVWALLILLDFTTCCVNRRGGRALENKDTAPFRRLPSVRDEEGRVAKYL